MNDDNTTPSQANDPDDAQLLEPPRVVARRRPPTNGGDVVPATPPPVQAQPRPTQPTVVRRREPVGPLPTPPLPRHLAREKHLANIHSRCRPDLAAPNRVDPYWTDAWPHHSSKEWMSRPSAERQRAAGLLDDLPEKLMTPPEVARAAILSSSRDRSPYTLNTYVAALGAIAGWRTCTTQQLAAFVGDPRLARHLSHPAATLFGAELIETTAPNLWTSGKARDLQLYRTTNSEAFARISPDLTFAERLGITGGQPYRGGGLHDRHNVFAAELGLRLAEYADVAAVLGEPFSTTNLLTGEGARRPSGQSLGGADLTAVRPDGMRIAIELTSTTSPYFDAKVERVAKMLAFESLKHTGLVVVFVVAPPISASASDHAHVLQETRNAIAKACRTYPGEYSDLTRNRIGVATWQSWFPAVHTASENFFAMRSERIVRFGNSTREDVWETVDFLSPDGFVFAPHDGAVMRTVIANAGMLGQTPYWLREKANRLARTAEIGRRASDGRGVASAPQIPARLLGLGAATDMERLGRDVRVHYAANPSAQSVGARRSAAEARRMCSAALIRVTQGEMTMDDVLGEAANGGSTHPYRNILLAQLLMAHPGVGRVSADRHLRRVVAFLCADDAIDKLTVGWLLHMGTAHRRERAWQEASRAPDLHAGFPWARLPTEA